MKKIFAALLVCALIMGCTACKKSNNESTDLTESVFEIVEYESGDAQDGETDSSADKSGKDAKDKYSVTLENDKISEDSNAQQTLRKELKDTAKGKKLKILSTWGEDGILNQSWRAMFKAICGGELEIIRCADWSAMQQKLASMHAANNAPDLYEMTNQDFPSIVYRNILLPLSDYIDFNSAVYTNADRENLSQLKFNGKVYFWPTFTDSTALKKGLWINKSLFENIPENQMPDALIKSNNWTWDTMYELVKKTTNKQKGIFGLAAPHNSCFAAGLVAATGEDFIKYTENGIICNYQSKNVTRAMNMFKKLADPNYCEIEKATEVFRNGKAAMMYGSAVSVADKKLNSLAKEGVIEIVPLPRDPQKKEYIVLGDLTGLAVPSGSKNRETAINFIRMLRASDYYNKQVGEIYYKKNNFTGQARKYSEDCGTKYKMLIETSMGIKEILSVSWQSYGVEYIEGNATWETRAAEFAPKIQSILDKLG